MTAVQQRAHTALALYADLIAACEDGRIHPASAWRHYLAGDTSQALYACETVERQAYELGWIAAGVREGHMMEDGVLAQEWALRAVQRWWEREERKAA